MDVCGSAACSRCARSSGYGRSTAAAAAIIAIACGSSSCSSCGSGSSSTNRESARMRRLRPRRARCRFRSRLKGFHSMCGIAGIVAADRLDDGDRARVPRMRDVIAHRGPDDAGLFVDDHAALGHRRLSIVDLAAGHQPLANEDESVWVVFNGEIYNHADVRPELEAAGHRYRTKSDTETIVHAYEQWGDACVERFRGMFAFAIWDA